MTLLPQQIVPVGRDLEALTTRHLGGLTEAMAAYFLELRDGVDADLAPRLPPAAGRSYPYGRCEEITTALFARLARRLDRPEDTVGKALRAFVADGGPLRTVWGVLREQYFQNAIQIGALYVDVSNDTVVPTKPKIEILPIDDSGLCPVRDIPHFVATAGRYWGAGVFANTVAPTLAPILPMVTHSPGRLEAGLQSACDYMIALMSQDGFRAAEDWLANAPEPPDAVVSSLLRRVPVDLRWWTGTPRREAVEACRRARAAACHEDPRWRKARVLDLLRGREVAAGPSTRVGD